MIQERMHCVLLAVCLVLVASCGGGAKEEVERVELRERLDEAVRLQFDADSCEAAMLIYSGVVASYRPDMSVAAKELVVEGLNRMWYVYYFMLFDYADAMECLEKGMDICEADTVEASRLYLNKGVTYSLLAIRGTNPSEKIFELADENLREAHGRALAAGNVNVADYSLLNMIVLYDKLSRPIDELYPVLARTLSLHNGKQDMEVAFSSALFDIVGWFQKEDYGSIVRAVDKMLDSYEFESDEIRNKYQLLLYKSRALTAMGRPTEALLLLDSVREDADSLGLSDVLMPVYELEADAYKLAGKPYESMRRKLAYYEQRDAQLSEEGLLSISELPLVHRIRKSQEALARENHRRKMISIYALEVTAVVVLLILFAVIVIRKNAKLRAANAVLFRRNEEQLRLFDERISIISGKDVASEEETPRDVAVCVEKESAAEVSDELQNIYNGVVEIVERCRLWSDSSLSISRVAVEMGVGEKVLSKAVNMCGGMNFSSFINRYRIMEASRMLGDDAFGKLSLQGIAESVGFKSRTSFIAAFKQFVGMLPSEYRKMAVEKKHTSADGELEVAAD